MLPPWFNAPLGSRMVSRHFQARTSGGTNQFHLHLDAGTGRQVPSGSQTIITHAFVGMTLDDPAPPLDTLLWADDYGTGWDIWSPEEGAQTPTLPIALNAAVPDWVTAGSLAPQSGVTAVPCPPLIAPVIIGEGHRAFVRVTNNSGARADLFGWAVGFVMPIVNDIPGKDRYFTEGRRS